MFNRKYIHKSYVSDRKPHQKPFCMSYKVDFEQGDLVWMMYLIFTLKQISKRTEYNMETYIALIVYFQALRIDKERSE
jgi:hypothetical protein